ncbi:hypothetical protein WJX75_005457 [Coccomyxa subellipsoidea]|uniref:Uncharacterized protein n=1 Tax=Coccomyxa subellipsoidea TaxID=248742 RepID=A0ABR2YC86_9CHLO
MYSELRAQFKSLLAHKNHLRDHQLALISEKRTSLREKTRQIKSKNVSIGAGIKIDDQITELDRRLAHSSMPLNEEKKIMAEIERLKASRAIVASYEDLLKETDALDKEADSIREQMKQCSDDMDAVNKRSSEIQEKFDKMRAKAREKNADIPALQAERDNCWEIVNKIYDKIKEIRAKFKEDNDVYWEAEQAWRAWRDQDRARKGALYQKEKEEHDKARQAEDDFVKGAFFHEEVGYCDQLTAYLSKFLIADAATSPAAAATSEAVTIDGYKVYKRKEEDADSVLGLSAGKKGGKKGKKGADRKPDQPAEQKLIHSLDNLKAFAKLNLEIPLTSSQVSATLELIQARKTYYLDQRAKRVENGEVPNRTPEPHANGGSANGHAETSSEAPAAANGSEDIDLASENMKAKLKVGKDEKIIFTYENDSFPALSKP